MSDKSINPKGTKDYGPIELLSRRFIINTIRKVFISFGYSEIETPSIEKRLTLYEKYGEEGDKFIFNIINLLIKKYYMKDCFMKQTFIS